MGKITIEFDSVEESQDARVALDAMKWKMAMWDLDQWLRAQYKYMPDNEYSKEAYEAYEKSREQLYQILNEAGLKLD